MKLVIIESPYAGDVQMNVEYACEAMADSLRRGEAPFASHLLYAASGVLDDKKIDERKQGMAAGFAWADRAHLTAVYVDRGFTVGMRQGIEDAMRAGRLVVLRSMVGAGWEIGPFRSEIPF